MKNTEMAKKSVEEAIVSIQEKPFESTLVERLFLLSEAWEIVKGYPQPLQMGKGLAYVLNRASLPIRSHDLLLGRYDDHVPTSTDKERVDAFLTNYYVTIDPDSNPVVCRNGGHETMDTESLITLGISGYIQKAAEKRKSATAANCDEEVAVYLEGIQCTFEAIRDYIARYAQEAERVEKKECAEVCLALTQGPPQTFRQALQLILFYYNIYLIYAGRAVSCLNTGRLDDILLPFYVKDLKAGILTEEDAGCLIDDFSAKMSLHLGRGEHQMAFLSPESPNTGWLRNPVYDSPGYITLGGYSNRGDHEVNPLTVLFAKHIHPKLKNPIYIFRYTNKCSPELLDIISQKITENASILVYNDETVIPAHLHIGVDPKDAVNYSIHPCNWADIAGGSTIFGEGGKELPALINDVLHSGRTFANMDEIYAVAAEDYAKSLKDMFDAYRKEFRADRNVSYQYLSLGECLFPQAIDNAGNREKSWVKYPAVYTFLRGIGTATDMLSAVDWLVFQKKKYTLPQLLQAADCNFEGCSEILNDSRKSPKYGTDDPFADGHAARLMTTVLDVIDREATNENGVRDVYTLSVTINDSHHIRQGAALPATVDGRRKGVPVTENLSPTVGCSCGVTALLNSVSKLPFSRIHSGALNVKLNKSVLKGTHSSQIIKALILSYMKKGGMQMQFSITNAEELRCAQENPDAYRDLLVRITGYSAVFVDISKKGQEEFIRREEMT